MDAFFFRTAFVVFFTLLTGACLAKEVEPPVAVNVQGLPTHTADRIREHAAKGQTELRWYLERTRMINQLRMESVVRNETIESAKRNAGTALAKAKLDTKD